MSHGLIPVAEPALGEEELRNVVEAVKSGWISSKGRFIEEFEEKFAEYCGARYGVSTSNGTAALHLALVALGVEKGDEVIVPTLTFISTANAVSYTGAKPVFADSHPRYWCIDPEKIEEKVTDRTKAIIPVHLYGHPCDMDAIIKIAKDHSLHTIEDAAEAHGAEYRNRKVGSLGDMGCFSFYGNKLITTGEGGMCITNDECLAEKMRKLRDHGMSRERRYWHEVIGFNYRMTNLQAAIGLAQLGKIDGFIEKKRLIFERYNSLFKDIAESQVTLPSEETWARSVFCMYSVLIEKGCKLGRDELIAGLLAKGVETRPFFCPIHSLPPYKNNEDLPVAQELSSKGINLPSSTNLTSQDLNMVATCTKIIIGHL